jgi:hypothetical protein
MAKPPRRPPPQKRKSDLPAGDAVASRAIVPKRRNPRQAAVFDRPLPAFIRPQLAKLVTEAPEAFIAMLRRTQGPAASLLKIPVIGSSANFKNCAHRDAARVCSVGEQWRR